MLRQRDRAARARVGISVGDVVHQDDDIFGSALIEAARLAAAAQAGQILCSELVRTLARGRGGFEFEILGLLELKGLLEPIATCLVRWDRVDTGPALALPDELVGATRGTSTLTFTYTVAAGENAPARLHHTSALTLNGGTISTPRPTATPPC